MLLINKFKGELSPPPPPDIKGELPPFPWKKKKKKTIKGELKHTQKLSVNFFF